MRGNMETITVMTPIQGRKWVNGKQIQQISRAFDVAQTGVDRVIAGGESWLWYYFEHPNRALQETAQ